MKRRNALVTIALLAPALLFAGCFTIESKKKQLREEGVALLGNMQTTYKNQRAGSRVELRKWISSYVEQQQEILDANLEKEKATLKLYALEAINESRIQTKRSLIQEFESEVETALSSIKDELKQEQAALLAGSGSIEKSKDLALKLSASLAIMHKNSEEIGLLIDGKYESLYLEIKESIENSLMSVDYREIPVNSELGKTVGQVIDALEEKLMTEDEGDAAMNLAYDSIEKLISKPSDLDLFVNGMLGKFSDPKKATDSLFQELTTSVSGKVESELNSLTASVESAKNKIFKKVQDKVVEITSDFNKKGS